MIFQHRPHRWFIYIAQCLALAIPLNLNAGRETVVFFGDSLTAGYQLDPKDAYPALIQEKIDLHGWPFVVVASGVSGETTAGGLRRINWQLRRPADVFVLALGANDGLRGVAPEIIQANLGQILDQVREQDPQADLLIAGMMMPPNMGPDYTRTFERIFPNLAEYHHATLIPFLLDRVAGEPALNLNDAIHPNESGHRIVAETVWQYLEPVLKKRLEAAGL